MQTYCKHLAARVDPGLLDQKAANRDAGHRSLWPVLAHSEDQRGETVMKKIFLVLAVAFVFTTGMTVVTVVGHTDQAIADCTSSNC
jgi:hypothetical protein